jgi:hypothetical protein
MTFRISNNCTTSLIAPLTNVATTAQVVTTAQFPTLAGGDFCYLTLISIAGGFDQYGNPMVCEIVKVNGPLTPGATQTINITRAQDNTTAKAFVAGDVADERVNAAALLAAAGGVGSFLQIANNLSDVADPVASLGNLKFKNPAASGVARAANVKMRDAVSVADFGAVGDGVTNDTPAFVAAANSLGLPGGTILVPNGFYCLIDTALSVPKNISIVGPNIFPSVPAFFGSGTVQTMGGALIVNSTVSITLGMSAGLEGLLIMRKGLVIPSLDASAFAGTAITASLADVRVMNCMILGFNQAIITNGTIRGVFQNLLLDNTNGIDISNSGDISKVSYCHAWPFVTLAGGGTDQNSHRAGKAFYVHALGDSTWFDHCFAYAYLNSFFCDSSNAVLFSDCVADGTNPQYAGSVGFTVQGTASQNKLEAPLASAQETGIYFNSSAAIDQMLVDPTCYLSSVHSVRIDQGDVSINGGLLMLAPDGVYVNNTSSRVLINGVKFRTISGTPVNVNVANSTTFISACDFTDTAAGTLVAGTNLACPTIASASPLNLPPTGDTFLVSGATGFSVLNGGWLGRRVTLVFQGALVISSSAVQQGMQLTAQQGYTTKATCSLSLIHNGFQWQEVGRGQPDIAFTTSGAIMTPADYYFDAPAGGTIHFRVGGTEQLRVQTNIAVANNEISAATMSVTNQARLEGGLFFTAVTKATTATLTAGQTVILVNAATAGFTITLPGANALGAGATITQQIQFIRIDTTANVVTVQRGGTDLIDGATSFVLAKNTVSPFDGHSVRLQADGVSNWYKC